ncbi:MAG: corrinoid protein [Ignavibacteriae bacterium]|nr:cobalamin-binding protein [Ignavibacteriota bacterium]NOH00249.1 corrinoid protein [Ignavibacteriota bacterium]
MSEQKTNLLSKLTECIEIGKAELDSPYPPNLKGEKGASEYTAEALALGIPPLEILEKSLMVGMKNIGDKFSQGKAFIPNLLISSKAMKAAMVHLKPYFDSGAAKMKGTLVIGTVTGDLHDIGKNIVKMVMEGNGWKVIDLGTDTSEEKFIAAVKENPDCIVGLSALLTTTMLNMEKILNSVKEVNPKVKVFVGGAPLSEQFSNSIGADGYFHDPQSLVDYLENNN